MARLDKFEHNHHFSPTWTKPSADQRCRDESTRLHEESTVSSHEGDTRDSLDPNRDAAPQVHEGLPASGLHAFHHHHRFRERGAVQRRLPLTVQVNRRPNVAVHLAGRSASHRQHGSSSSTGSSRSGGDPPDGESDSEPPGLAPAGASCAARPPLVDRSLTVSSETPVSTHRGSWGSSA